MINLINEVEKLQKAAGILKEAPIMPPAAPAKDTRTSSVQAYDKGLSQATNVTGKSSQIKNLVGFGQAFEVWVKTLGMDPKRFTKQALRGEVEKVLIKLGYK